MGLSRLSKKCRECPFVSKCSCKRMEALAYLQPMVQEASQPLASDVAVKHDYRDIKVAHGTAVTIDVEALKENMRKDYYRGMLQGGA